MLSITGSYILTERVVFPRDMQGAAAAVVGWGRSSAKKAIHSSSVLPDILKRFLHCPPLGLTDVDLPDFWTPTGGGCTHTSTTRRSKRDSHAFVRIKTRACDEVGIASFVTQLPPECTEGELSEAVSCFNENPSPLFIPCVPNACIELLLRSGVELIGKKAAVIGRSKIAGLPTSLPLQRHHETVSLVHSYTKNPEELPCGAVILVLDVGVPNLIQCHWLKPGAVVIDMGTNSVKDPNSLHGYRMVGDVCYEEAIKKASVLPPCLEVLDLSPSPCSSPTFLIPPSVLINLQVLHQCQVNHEMRTKHHD
ncbi:unnamed protein product [Ilex paraguariensis]|uniref:Tetrahydrofolate dehydrogenase/cyclohydrolase NAD(P)-binding domain-containing protein n=1 Tax=Ilex paraguariensis TaxID=185542 RepID=A0ABC8SV01_9AQUA